MAQTTLNKLRTEAGRVRERERISNDERKAHIAVAPEKHAAGSFGYDAQSNPIKLRGVSANG